MFSLQLLYPTYPFSRKMFLSLPFLILFFSFFGCSTLYKTPDIVKLEQMEFTNATDSTVTINLMAILDNPNKTSVELSSFDSEVIFQDNLIGIGQSVEQSILKARDTSRWKVESIINIPTLAEIYPNIIDKDSVEIKLKSKLVIAKPSILANQTVKKTLRFNVSPQEILNEQFSIFLEKDGFKIRKFKPQFSLTKIKIKVDAVINNPFPFDWVLTDLDLQLKMGESEIIPLEWQSSNPINIKANESTNWQMTMDVNSTQVSVAVLKRILFNEKAGLLEGKCTIMAFDKSFQVPVQKTISLDGQSLKDLIDIFPGRNN